MHIIAWDSGKGNARHNGLLSVSNRELASAIYAVDLDALERLAEYPRPLDIEVSVSKFGNMISLPTCHSVLSCDDLGRKSSGRPRSPFLSLSQRCGKPCSPFRGY